MVGGDAISNFIVDIGVLNRAQLPRATARLGVSPEDVTILDWQKMR